MDKNEKIFVVKQKTAYIGCMLKWVSILLWLLVPFVGMSQILNGIWKGFFTTGFGDDKQYYKYEAQIVADGDGSGLSGISYSYLNADFFGKCRLEGHYDASAKKLDVKEVKLVRFSNANRASVCLMHSILSYYKKGNGEVLEGTFTSANSATGSDCGQGYIYLERARKSDFHTEPFLARTKKHLPARPQKKYSNPAIAKNNKTDTNRSSGIATLSRTHMGSLTPRNMEQKADTPDTQTTMSDAAEQNAASADVSNPVIQTFASIPEIFQKRKNKLVKTIVTHTPEVDISFYDNGEIDDDSITVYHNLNPIIQRGRLSHLPISYGFDASDNNRFQSFIIVADNLGKIPPNSALMVIYTNHERYEVFIESDLKTNGEVRIVYEPVKEKK